MKAKKHSFWLNYYVAVLLALILIVPSFIFNFNISPTQAAIGLDGDGDPENPYKITCTADLKTFADWVNSGNTGENKYFELTNNISGAGVPVIGSLVYGTERRFKGTFDGNGFSISNVNRTNNSTNQQGDLGLFGYVQGTIKNLIVLNGTITLSVDGKSVGAIAGSTYEGSIIERCFNAGCTVQVTSSNMNAAQTGGIIGAAGGSTTIKYSGNSAVIKNNSKNARAGGIMGIQNEGITTITECFNAGSITAGTTSSNESFAGGIIGQNGTISYCYNTGSITANAESKSEDTTKNISFFDHCEGLTVTLEDYRYLKTTEYAYCGGIVGYSTTSVKYCYNTGSINGGKARVLTDTEMHLHAITDRANTYSITQNQDILVLFDYDENIFFSGINGNINISSTNCFSTYNNLYSNVSCSISEHVYSHRTPGGDTNISNTTRLDVYSNAYNLNQTISVYNIPNLDATVKNTSVKVFCSSTNISLSLSTNLTWTTGMLWWKENHDETINPTAFSSSITRIQNYTLKGASDMKNQNFVNSIGSSIWGINSLINNGYPYLKNTMWTSSAQSF